MSYLTNQIIPSGTVIPWWSTLTSIPSGWTLCNGASCTLLSGATSTTPNMIGMFVQGSDITGGTSVANASGFSGNTNQSIVGATTHSHTISGSQAFNTNTESADQGVGGPTANVAVASELHYHSGTFSYSSTSSTASTQPASYAVPFIMKL